MSSGKSASQSKDYSGHMAWEFGYGPADFIWGIIIQNELVWPKAKIWDSQIWKNGTLVLYTDGNVYKALVKTDTDPTTSSDWQLFAAPWVAGTYAKGVRKLYLGNVWEVTATPNTNTVPHTDPPVNHQGIEADALPWKYLGTPKTFSIGDKFWDAGSIVVWHGQIFETSVGTKTEPGAIGSDWILFRRTFADVAVNPYPITIENFGQFYLYWGTATETLDAVDEEVLTDFGHPPYRFKTKLVGKGFKWGTMRTNPPDVQLLLGRAPKQSIITGGACDLDEDWQANPWTVLAEMLTDPVNGLGLPDSFFNKLAWQAEADRCAADPQLFYISPMYDSFKNVRELVADLMSYPDAFIFLTAAALLSAGHWPHGEPAPAFTAANTLDRDCLAERENFKWSSQLWAQTATSVEVSFKDWKGGFKSRSVPANSLYAQGVLKGVQLKKIDRPHIVRDAQTLAWANEYQKIFAQRSAQGSNKIKAEKAASIVPGAVFRLTDDHLGVSFVKRCTRVQLSKPPEGTRLITYETERGVSAIPYSPTPENRPASGIIPLAVKTAVFVQTPSALGDGPHELTMLATRTDLKTSSANLWYKQRDNSAYQDLGRQTAFAVGGRFGFGINSEETTGSPGTSDNVQFVTVGAVTQGNTYDLGDKSFWQHQIFYSVNMSGFPHFTGTEGVDYLLNHETGALTILAGGAITTGQYVNAKLWNTLVMAYDPLITPQGDVDEISAALTEDEIADNELLIFAVKLGDPTQFEIMTVRSVQAVGLDVVVGLPMLFVKVWRAQYGTLMGGDGSYVWAKDDLLFVIKRKNLQPFTHADFAQLEIDGATADLIVTANSPEVDGEIGDLQNDGGNPEGLATAWTYTFANKYSPTVELLQLLNNGADISGVYPAGGFSSVNFVTTDKVQMLINIQDRNSSMNNVSVVGVIGEQQFPIVSQALQPSASQNVLLQFSFPRDGLWKLLVNVTNLAGNASTTILPADYAGGILVGTHAESPIIWKYDIVGGQVANLQFGLFFVSTVSIKWEVKDRGLPPDAQGSGSFTNSPASTTVGGFQATAKIPAFAIGKTLYAYATDSGGAPTSETVQFNIDE